MKTTLVLLAALPIATFGAQARVGTPASPAVPSAAVSPVDPVLPSTAQIRFALEEERVAHDLYVAAAAKWNLSIFEQIASAETRHAAALTGVAARLGVTPPPALPGTYADPDLQALYHQLLALVQESPTAALRVGALVEETDIADLRRLAAGTTDAATRTVLGNLERASYRHLAAFVGQLAAAGITYEPQILTPADFAAITQAGAGRGGPGRGSRNRNNVADTCTGTGDNTCPAGGGWRGGR